MKRKYTALKVITACLLTIIGSVSTTQATHENKGTKMITIKTDIVDILDKFSVTYKELLRDINTSTSGTTDNLCGNGDILFFKKAKEIEYVLRKECEHDSKFAEKKIIVLFQLNSKDYGFDGKHFALYTRGLRDKKCFWHALGLGDGGKWVSTKQGIDFFKENITNRVEFVEVLSKEQTKHDIQVFENGGYNKVCVLFNIEHYNRVITEEELNELTEHNRKKEEEKRVNVVMVTIGGLVYSENFNS